MKTRPGKHEIIDVNRRQFIGKSSAMAAGLGLLTLGTHSGKTLAQQADERRPAGTAARYGCADVHARRTRPPIRCGPGVVTENGFEMFNTLGLELHSV